MMCPKTHSAEIVIIGGGITGISTAYFLARRGQTEVVLLEKNLLAQASTGLCVGGIRQQFTHPSNIYLSQDTIRLLKQSLPNVGTTTEFHQVGYLFLAQKQETWENMLNGVRIQHDCNVPVETLSQEGNPMKNSLCSNPWESQCRIWLWLMWS